MARGKWIGLGAALLLGLAALWYFASPAWTLSRMQAAAKAGDADALLAMVDLPALREDMKAELNAALMKQAANDQKAAAGAAFGALLIGPMVDAALTPAGIRAAMAGAGAAAASSDKLVRGGGLKLPAEPVIVRRGLSEFLVAPKDKPTGGLVFRRSGLSWKLSGIDPPRD